MCEDDGIAQHSIDQHSTDKAYVVPCFVRQHSQSHAQTYLVGFLHSGKPSLVFCCNCLATLSNLVGMHPQTLAFVGLFDLLMRGISLHTKEGIKVFLVSGGVRPQEGLAAAQKEREIVPHRVSDVCVCVCRLCVCVQTRLSLLVRIGSGPLPCLLFQVATTTAAAAAVRATRELGTGSGRQWPVQEESSWDDNHKDKMHWSTVLFALGTGQCLRCRRRRRRCCCLIVLV